MSDYLDEDLAASRRSRMERHIGECEECRRLLNGLRRMLDGLNRLPAPAGADALRIADSVRVRLRESE
jgi:anti-sigma factor RsiW